MADTGFLPAGLTHAEASGCSQAASAYLAAQFIAPRMVEEAFRSLFENKHLYQSVQIPSEGPIEQAAGNFTRGHLPPINASLAGRNYLDTSTATVEKLTKVALSEFLRAFSGPWVNAATNMPAGGLIAFNLPKPAIIFCPACDARTAFHPVPVNDLGFAWVGTSKVPNERHYTFGYECQQCRGPMRERVVFTVVRRGMRLTLCGRSPLETVRVESYIPKGPARFFSGGIIAKNAGQPLAGLFMLRTFVEQFWRIVEPVESKRLAAFADGKRLTGDELAMLYGTTLPTAMKESFPSLGKVYTDLSGAIHAAQEGDEAIAVFEKAEAEIKKHFDARRVFEL